MRITSSMTARNYNKQLNQAYSKYVDLFNQASTGMRFTKMSEDTASGVRAMRIRRNLSRIDAYESNIKSAQSYLDAGEATLMQVNEIVHSVTERWTQAMNDTNESVDRDAIKKELQNLQDELLSLMNGRFSDRYLFGGSNTISAPFTVDDGGNLYYNGVNIQDIDKNHPLANDAFWLDIGLGVSFDGDSQQVTDNTAFNSALVGATIFGYGESNLYLVLGEMINMLDEGNYDKEQMGDLLTRFQDSSNYVNQQLTELGASQSYLDFSLDRLSAEKINLETRQASVEYVDATEAILLLQIQEYVYYAALQMGQSLLQPTLFNYIS